jgi:AcrR family transcriptional regulator
MATKPKGMDRRVVRTRRSILQAAREIMREKGFDAMTVQDIADRANVNRGTFYAHFADKYELVERMIREEFRQHLDERVPPDARWGEETLQRLISAVMDFFARCYPPDAIGSMIHRATYEELVQRLTGWLHPSRASGQPAGQPWRVPPETIARVVVWAVLGAAAYRSRTPDAAAGISARDVWLVLAEGLNVLVPDGHRSPPERGDAAGTGAARDFPAWYF